MMWPWRAGAAAIGLLHIGLAFGAPAGLSILYADTVDWRQETVAGKQALAADFMRIFCFNARMSTPLLASCIDRKVEGGARAAILDLSLACAAEIDLRVEAAKD